MHKKLSLLMFAFLFFIVSMAFLFGGAKKSQTNNGLPLTPTPSISLNVVPLALPTIYPIAGNVQIAGTQTAISVFFTDPMDTHSIKVQASPTIDFKVGVLADIPQRIILTPQQNWQGGITYTIKVSSGAITLDGKKRLNQDFIFKYTVTDVPTPQFME